MINPLPRSLLWTLQDHSKTAGDKPGFVTLYGDTVAKLEQAREACKEAFADYDRIVLRRQELQSSLKTALNTENKETVASWKECLANPAIDIQAVAESLTSKRRATQYISDTLDYVNHVEIPNALDSKLAVNRDLRYLEALETELIAALAEIEILEKIVPAFGQDKVVVINERVEELKRIAVEYARIAQVAENELRAHRAAHAERMQKRQIGGVTRAEAINTAYELARQEEEKDTD